MSKVETITPMGFNVLVEIVEHETKTKGGIILIANDQKEIRSELVKIITCGDSAFTNCFGDKHLPSSTQSYALIQRNTGQPFTVVNSAGDKKYQRLVASDHILAVMSPEVAIKYCQDNFNFQLNIEQND